MQKIFYHTKEKKIPGCSLFIKFCCMLFIAIFMLASVPADHIFAASGIKIYNYTTKKEVTYTDKQIKVTYNGKQISKDATPGILENGIALVSYMDIFAKSEIDADCIYNKEKGTVSVSKFGITIVMTINSRTGYINGKAVTMPVAPVKIKYIKEDITNILVPSRFVCENLGYDYTWNSSTNTVAIKKDQNPLPLSYDGDKMFYYTGVQGVVSIDGSIVDPGKMPSIITNNTAMLRAKRVFADSKIDADYRFDETNQSLTLSRNGNKLEMKIGSPVAYLNGKPMILDTPPMIVSNHEAKTSYVMVPGSFTASCLGFDYRWDKNIRTSIITSRKDEDTAHQDIPPTDEGNGGNTEPELGDSGIISDPGTILQEWKANTSLIGKSSNRHQINPDSKPSGNAGTILTVERKNDSPLLNSETYAIVADRPFEKITSRVEGSKIYLNISNMVCNDRDYLVYGNMGYFVDTINTRINPADNGSSIAFNLKTKQAFYDLTLSEDKRTLYVTVYFNSLNKVTIGTNDTGDYITLSGLNALEATESEQGTFFYIDLPGTINGIGDQNLNIFGSKHLNFAYAIGYSDRTQIILGIQAGCEYYISENGNLYTITIQNPGIPKPSTPQLPNMPQNPSGTDQPEITDKSKYEIIIPNPAGLSVSQIKQEDDYNHNRFSIRIPGDYTAFFQTNPITLNSMAVQDVSVFLNNNYETEILISTSRLQGYELVSDKNSIYVNVGEPRDIYQHIVVLDPGHGGPANGAQYFGTNEKEFNLKILYEIGKKYFNANPAELKVYYTRETDVDLTLAERAAYAENIGADLFVSLHMNASTSAGAHGTEVYYSDNNNRPNKAGLTSKAMATLFVNNLTQALGTDNRGAKSERYTVVHKNTVPAVLIELGFLSNKSDYAKLSDPTFQDQAARVIYNTLLQIFDLYPTGR